MVCDSPEEPLTPEKIGPDHEGCILVGGSIVTAAALKKAIDDFDTFTYSSLIIQKHAKKFSEKVFKERMQDKIASVLEPSMET